MKLRIRVGTGKRRAQIMHPGEFEKESTDLLVHVTAQRQKGAANREVVTTLAKHFKVPPASVRIVAGKSSKKKIVEITIGK